MWTMYRHGDLALHVYHPQHSRIPGVLGGARLC